MVEKEGKYKFKKFHSSHAFDCLVVKGFDLKFRVVKRFILPPNFSGNSLPEGSLCEEPLEDIRPASWNHVCFTDSRRRTFAFMNKDYVKFDFGLNLASCVKPFSKKEKRALAQGFTREYDFVMASDDEDESTEEASSPDNFGFGANDDFQASD